jgi:hypothetical protein
MDYQTKEQIIKRLKSLSWRLGGMIIVFVLTGISEQILPILEISDGLKIFLGLVIGEVTKFINS